MSGYTLALDQGSQSSRALVYSASGELLAIAQQPVATFRASGSRVEQRPEELVESLRDVIADVAGQVDATLITRAGLATQRSSIVCWNKRSGKALSPVLSWQDTRAAQWMEQFVRQETRVRELTGLPLSPHYGVSKLCWCLENIEQVRLCAATDELAIGPLASYLVYQLLDEHPLLVDPANASRTLLYDFTTLDWSEELASLFGIPLNVLPATTSSLATYGTLDVAGQGVPFGLLTGDQSAALFGFGAVCRDTVYANLGTGAFLQRPSGRIPVTASGLLASVVYTDSMTREYVLEGTVNGAGSALNTMATELQLETKWVRQQLPLWLDAIDDPPLFLNGVSGLGSPWWIAGFESQFVGEAEVPGRLVAVIESIVFMLQANLEVSVSVVGPAKRWFVTGGLGQVAGLCQRLADLSGLEVVCPAESEASAQGVAFLLSGAHGFQVRIEESVYRPAPNSKLAARYGHWQYAMSEAINNIHR